MKSSPGRHYSNPFSSISINQPSYISFSCISTPLAKQHPSQSKDKHNK
jgi:hypothetical protein